jgi:hypothetical protein
MASAKTKSADGTQTSSTPAASADTALTAAASQPPASGRKLRWSSLSPDGVLAHRAKKPKAKKPATTKTESAKAKGGAVKSDKLSALDAAAKVLKEAGQPMNCQELIKAMAAKGYWTSPAGKTPAATLYSAILRETKIKGGQARFQKTSRGHFVYHSPQASDRP